MSIVWWCHYDTLFFGDCIDGISAIHGAILGVSFCCLNCCVISIVLNTLIGYLFSAQRKRKSLTLFSSKNQNSKPSNKEARLLLGKHCSGLTFLHAFRMGGKYSSVGGQVNSIVFPISNNASNHASDIIGFPWTKQSMKLSVSSTSFIYKCVQSPSHSFFNWMPISLFSFTWITPEHGYRLPSDAALSATLVLSSEPIDETQTTTGTHLNLPKWMLTLILQEEIKSFVRTWNSFWEHQIGRRRHHRDTRRSRASFHWHTCRILLWCLQAGWMVWTFCCTAKDHSVIGAQLLKSPIPLTTDRFVAVSTLSTAWFLLIEWSLCITMSPTIDK